VKQIAQNYRSGELLLVDVPPPACRPGGVLVRSHFSLVSTGTEMMKIEQAKLSLAGKARARPDQVRKVVDTAVQVGPLEAYRRATNKLDSLTPLGYSLAGEVVEVGRGAGDLAVGQLVACAGNEYALHAEVNWVPTNLCVPVGSGVRAEHAAFATVGAIALQGVRRAETQLGESACVIGLGLVGQLTVQLLVAAGVRVFGFDPVAERCRIAEESGATVCAAPDAEGVDLVEKAILHASGDLGADCVLVTAGGDTNEPLRIAARVARDRARVVDVGKCRIDLPWNDYYAKELDVRFSRSYGPGRYDETYELEGIDYPAGYVRWTERRNLACFVDLLERNALDLTRVHSATVPFARAAEVYEEMRTGARRDIGLLFEYPPASVAEQTEAAAAALEAPAAAAAPARRTARAASGFVRVGFLGAGSYASSTLLPLLRDDERVELACVATNRSLSALDAQRKFGFVDTTTSVDRVLDDERIDAVFVVTRHHSHADLACRALERGKAVFVEKPLALSEDELDRVLAAAHATPGAMLMVGFNRRFAPRFVDLKQRFAGRGEPGHAHYLVSAGRLDATSWYANEVLEGSRFVGEGGHFVDTLSWWFDAAPVEVRAMPGINRDDVIATIRYDNGSLGTITYVTDGSARAPKETFDASAAGHTARLENFRRTTAWNGRHKHTSRPALGIDKGQGAELRAFVDAVRTQRPSPIPLESLATTTRATLAIARSLDTGRPERP
jgi:predicted dehydrogenase/threonine dehydrogenase-like Zn-dependent dehydrogenase